MKNILILLLASLSSLGQNQTGAVAQGSKAELIDSYLGGLAKEKSFSGGVLIMQGTNVLLKKGYGWANREKQFPFTASTFGSIGSITKAFTATAILKLVEMKKLKVKDPLSKFFSNVPADKKNITIHQLLTHSSGFVDFLEGDHGDFEKIETNAFLNRAFKQPLVFAPGTKAVYTNVGMSVLGIIIEKITGMDYEKFLQSKVLAPVGINGIAYKYSDAQQDNMAHGYQSEKDWGTHQQRYETAGGGPYWNLKANGGLEVSLDDMVRWVNAFTNKTILPDSLIQKMFSAQVLEEGYDGQSHFGYGCNISKSRRGTKMIDNGGSNGIYHARLIRLPEENVVFYLITNNNALNANMVMPNITQLYFEGKITRDFAAQKFDHPVMNKLYELLTQNDPAQFQSLVEKEKLNVDDDMVLFEVGQKLTNEGQTEQAIALYQYYNQAFPNIVVAWNELGELYLQTNNKQEAKKCFEQALKLRPGNPRATENLKKLN